MNARVEIELPRNLLTALEIPESELSRRAKEWVVLELFQEGEISTGKASEILGLSKAHFLDLLNERRLPYLDADPRELAEEMAAAEAATAGDEMIPERVSDALLEEEAAWHHEPLR